MQQRWLRGVLGSIGAIACAPSSQKLPLASETSSHVEVPAESSAATAGDAPGSASTTGMASSAATGSEGGEGGASSGVDETSTGGVPDKPRWEQLISADPFPRLVIEVDYVAGREPRATSVTQLEAVLAEILDKPGGVEVVLDQQLDTLGRTHAWTVDERLALADATFDLVVPADTIKIHALFVDGHAAEDDAMDGVLLGVAWGHESIMMFRDTLDGGCNGLVVGALVEQLCAEAEQLIWQHEVGHVVGLVDADLPMQVDHLDHTPGAGKHDVSHDCVMYREYEGLDALDTVLDRLLGGGPPIELDAACLADLDAVK